MRTDELLPADAAQLAPRDVVINQRLTALIAVSLLVFAISAIIELGLAATPYETTDRFGRAIGFNDRLYAEHYLILWRNFHAVELLKPSYAYAWLLAAMQFVGVWLLLTTPRHPGRATRWFFAAQAFLFPLGLLLCYLPPVMLVMILTGNGAADREGFTDFGFGVISIVGQSTWVFVSLWIVFLLRGPGLGLLQVWRALVAASRMGARTFIDAVR